MIQSNNDAYTQLLRLHAQHCSIPNHNYFNDWIESIKKHSDTNRQTLIDVAVDAANISYNISNNPEFIRDPLVVSAIEDTVPTFDFSNPPTGAALEGAINTAKGKYFEYMVVDKLNNGQRVGDVVLPDGYSAKVAESLSQPGWDIEIFDQNSRTAEYLQLKATDSTAYIKEALDRYPDITILTTEEALISNDDNHLILDSDISNSELENTLMDNMGVNDVSIDTSFYEAFNPLLSLALIVGTEGYKLSVSNKDIDQVTLSLSHRMTRTITSQGLGALVYALGGGWLALPTTVLAGYMYEQMARLYETSIVLNNAKETLVLLRLEQQERIMQRE